MSPDIVYANTVDRGTWQMRVERTGPYRAVLTVTRVADGREILREDVGLAYDAVFGPDAADLAAWQHKTLTAIDTLPPVRETS